MNAPSPDYVARIAHALIGRIVRTAEVIEVAPVDGLVRVRFEDVEDVAESPWLPWASAMAGPADWSWVAPSVGARVVVFSPGGDTEAGFIMGSLMTDASNAPGTDTDRVFNIGNVRIVIADSGDVTITTPGTIKVLTDVEIDGDAVATGEVTAKDGVQSVSLSTHKHVTGTGPSDAPTPGT